MDRIRIDLLENMRSVSILPPKRKVPKFLRQTVLRAIDWLKDFDDRLEDVHKYIRQVELTEKTLSELCLDEYVRVYNITGSPPVYLIIGGDTWHRLCGEIMDNSLGFRFTPDIYINGGKVWNGLQVVVVPWISGFFCLPRLEDLI